METYEEWKQFVKELKTEWKSLWRHRIDDKVRAEGIANKDYSKLFVEQGTVIIATRDYYPLDFVDILAYHKPSNLENGVPPSPSVGGWRKFSRDVLNKQKRFTHREGRPAPPESKKKAQQLKKGGRGWLHLRGLRNRT